MVKVKYTPATHHRKKRVLKQMKGARGGRSKLYRTAAESLHRSLYYAYRDRKVRKRDFRRLWISRINGSLKNSGFSYSRFMNGLKKANVTIDRKILSDLAINDNAAFNKLVDLAKETSKSN